MDPRDLYGITVFMPSLSGGFADYGSDTIENLVEMWLVTASWILHLFVGLKSFRFLRNRLFPNQIKELERHADQVQVLSS